MDETGVHDANRSNCNADLEESLATAELEEHDVETQEILELMGTREPERVADDTNDEQWGRLRVEVYTMMMNGKKIWLLGIFEGCPCCSNNDEVVEHQEKKPSGSDREK
jgi:hypothetical protein